MRKAAILPGRNWNRRNRELPILLAIACWTSTARPERTRVAPGGTLPTAANLISQLPHQSWPKHGASTIGLLVESHAPWGPTFLWGPYLRIPGKPEGPGGDCYLYLSEGFSTQALYFPATDKQGKHHLKGWTVPLPDGTPTATMDVAMMCPRALNPYGFKKSAHLVRLEVNDGNGAGPNLHFIATKVEILDGTDSHPLRPAALIASARKRFDQFIRERGGDISALQKRWPAVPKVEPGPSDPETVDPDTYLNANEKRRKKPRWGRPQRIVQEGVFPTWRESQGELSILFVQNVSAERTRSFNAIDPWQCQKGPCYPRRVEEVVEMQQAGALLGYEVSYDRKGVRVREQFFGPTYTSSN